MIYILLLFSFLNAAEPSRQWIVTPRVSFGAMNEPVNIDIPRYKPDTVEYKILQQALDLESVFPYDVQYESTYLSNIPQSLHDIASKRNTTYMKIAATKKAGKAVENDTTGFLDASTLATPAETEVINTENANRKELYSLISKYLKLNATEKEKVAKLYAQAIKYQKYYALSGEPVFTVQQDTHILTSMASSYKYKTVWENFVNVLNEEKFILEKADMNQPEGMMLPKYKCGTEERRFVIRLCTIKDKKLSGCKNSPKDESLYSYVNSGTLIWIEGTKDKDKTLILTDESNESQEIRYCKGETKKFDLLEKLSSKLIAADPNKPVVPSVPPPPVDKIIIQATPLTSVTQATTTKEDKDKDAKK
ncbi:MAG: hypothetical protein NTY22_09120 [Proteobacteria bacterium]|nr:hypothetical protein [Pseudomonadota bacterium]